MAWTPPALRNRSSQIICMSSPKILHQSFWLFKIGLCSIVDKNSSVDMGLSAHDDDSAKNG